MTRIRGELDLVLRGDVAEPPRSQLEGIRDEVELLSGVCRRLLLLARLDEQARDASLLGLAIVRGIARAHGGRVELAEGEGGGSVFRLVLPAATV